MNQYIWKQFGVMPILSDSRCTCCKAFSGRHVTDIPAVVDIEKFVREAVLEIIRGRGVEGIQSIQVVVQEIEEIGKYKPA